MACNFLKQNVIQNLEKDSLMDLISNNENFDLLSHNIENFKDVLSFLNNHNEQIMVINGFMGCGKSCLTNFIIEHVLNEDIITFKINFNGLNHIDDLYIQIYYNLYLYHQKQKIKMKTVEIKEFSQKVLFHILSIKQPILFVFDFDENINDKIINDLFIFIKELTTKKENKAYLKIIINSLSFNFDIFTNYNLKYSNSVIRPYNNESIKYELFNLNKAAEKSFYKSKCDIENCSFFYKITRGHFIYIEFIKVFEDKFNLSVNDFLQQYKNQSLYILDFIISNLMNKYYNRFQEFFIFLTLNKLQTPIKIIYENNLINEEDLNVLISNKIVKKDNNIIYLKSYVKKYVLNNITDKLKIEITKLLLNIYRIQLEYTPIKREIKVSRASLHNDIEYHNTILSKLIDKSINIDKNMTFSSISYLKSREIITSFDTIQKDDNKKNIEEKNIKNIPPSNKDIKIIEKKISPLALTKEEHQLLLTPSSKISTDDNKIQSNLFNTEKEQIVNNIDKKQNDYQIDNLFESALNYEKKLEYYKAIDIYNSILNMDIDNENKKLIYTYTKLGLLYHKLSNYKKSLNYYKKALEICNNKNEITKAYYIYSQIAKIYKATFKNESAREIYEKILNEKNANIQNKIKIQIILDYVEVIKTTQSVIETLLSIKNIVDNSGDIGLKIDYYYKLALGYDEIDDIDKAKINYNRCIELINFAKGNLNIKYKGNIYYNIGNICLDENNDEEAYKYFKLSLDFEIENKNYEEAYHTTCNLGKMLIYKKDNEAYKYFNNAILYAKKLNDKFYIAEGYLNLGDYYYFKKEDEKALNCFLLVLSILEENKFSNENIKNVKSRLNDLKIRLGRKKYDFIVNKQLKD